VGARFVALALASFLAFCRFFLPFIMLSRASHRRQTQCIYFIHSFIFYIYTQIQVTEIITYIEDEGGER
jgi:hypothetical protein